jgi:hypothetical protein
MALLFERLFTAYLVFLPWLLFAIGLLFFIVGSTSGRPNRRVAVIGLWILALSALWLVGQMLLSRL